MAGKTGTAGVSCNPFAKKGKGGFTLIEMILVVAVIGIMTSLVIAAVTNSTADARRVIARQQQATVQEALNAWIASTNSAAAFASYNANSGASNRLALVSKYLDTKARWMDSNSFVVSGTTMQSENMKSINASMSFGDWPTNGYPVVNLKED